MADTSGLPPEGWYPDRPNATRLRHWTGTGWTNEFRPIDAAPERVVPEPVRETTDQATSRRELRAQLGSLAQGEPDVPAAGIEPMARATPQPVVPVTAAPAVAAPVPVAEPAPTPTPAPAPVVEPEPEPEPEPDPEPVVEIDPTLSSVDRARVAGGYAPIRQQQQQPWQESFIQNAERPGPSSQTFAGWLYAASPLWLGALLIASMTLLSLVNPLLVQAGLGIVGFAMTYLLARQDVRQLKDNGFRAPSMWWVLLPFFYFVVRLVRVGVRSVGMVVTYLLSLLALVGLLYFAFFGNPALLGAITPSTPASSTPIPSPVATLSAQERANLLTPDGVEAQLRVELAKTFDVGTLDCVPFPKLDAGTTTTCVAQLDDLAYNVGLEVTPDEPDKAFAVTGMLAAP